MKKVNIDFFNFRGFKMEFVIGDVFKVRFGMNVEVFFVYLLEFFGDMIFYEWWMVVLYGFVVFVIFDVLLLNELSNVFNKMFVGV